MQIFEKRSSGLGPKAMSLLTGVGLGAALMYLLDPERGKGRRSVARDKAVALANRTGRVVARRSRDLSNRAKGVASEIRSAAGFRDKDREDEVRVHDVSNDHASDTAQAAAQPAPAAQTAQTAQTARPAQTGQKTQKPDTGQTAPTPGGI